MGEVLSELAALHVVALVLISVVAAIVQGSLGFGFAIVSVPLLVLLDPRLAPVPQILAALPLSLLIWWREREGAEMRAVALMTLGRIPGTYLGYLLLLVASARVLDLVIGSLVLFAVLVLAFGRAVSRTPVTESVAGVLSGAAAYVSAIGGPPVALLYKGAKGEVARASLSLVFVIGTVVTLAGRALGGALTELDLWLGAIALPSVLLGLWISRFIKNRIEGRPMQAGILALCTLAALALLGRAGGAIPSPRATAETEAPPDADPARRSARRSGWAPSRRVPGLGASGSVRATREPGATARLSGRVVDAETGAPIDRVRLIFGGPSPVAVETDASGDFSVRFGEPGAYALQSAAARGYATLDGAEVSLAVEARPGWVLEGVELRLHPEPWVDGVVVDEAGEGVAGATVRIVGAEDRAEGEAGGRFRIRAPIDSVLEATEGSRRGRARVGFAATLAPIRIVLRDAVEALGAIGGYVRSATGEPVVGAPVTLRTEAPPASPVASVRPALRVRTDAAGAFRFDEVLPGSYTAETAVEDWGAAERGGLQPGDEVTLELEPEARLAGRVVDSGAQPVAGAVVALRRVDGSVARLVAARAVLDPEGRFAVGGLLSGPYRIHALAPGFAPSPERTVQLEVGDNSVEPLVLASGGVLTGRVTDAESGDPLVDARVVVEGSIDGGAFLERSARTDADGRYRLEAVGPEVRSVHARAEAHHTRVLGGLRPLPGQVTVLDVELTPLADGETPRIELVGIGAVLGAVPEGLRLGQVVEGGGAHEVGLAPGDIITAIDGEVVEGLAFAECIDRIRGPEGSVVVLRLLRGDATVEIAVPRRRIRA